MIADFYRDLAIHLGPLARRERNARHSARVADMALILLDAVHTNVMRTWPQESAESYRIAVINAYEDRRAQLSGQPSAAQAVLVG